MAERKGEIMSDQVNKIEDLKYAIFSEWCYDPPAGTTTLYYDAEGKTYAELVEITDEIIDHIQEFTDDELPILTDRDDLSREEIEDWTCEAGGVNGDCVLFAEGEEIVDAVIDFCEENLLDWAEDVDFDDETIDLEFTVMISPNKWEGCEIETSVPVTREEAGLLSLCAFMDEEIDGFEGLENLVDRIRASAIDEAYDSWEGTGEGEEFEDLSGAYCSVSGNPVEAEDYLRIAIDSMYDHVKSNSDDYDTVIEFLDTVSEWIQSFNDSMM